MANHVKSRGRGILLYILNEWVPFIEHLHVYLPVSLDLEIVLFKINIPKMKRISFCIIYRPQDGNVNNAVTSLENINELKYSRINYELLVIGDSNINYKRTRSNEYKGPI